MELKIDSSDEFYLVSNTSANTPTGKEKVSVRGPVSISPELKLPSERSERRERKNVSVASKPPAIPRPMSKPIEIIKTRSSHIASSHKTLPPARVIDVGPRIYSSATPFESAFGLIGPKFPSDLVVNGGIQGSELVVGDLTYPNGIPLGAGPYLVNVDGDGIITFVSGGPPPTSSTSYACIRAVWAPTSWSIPSGTIESPLPFSQLVGNNNNFTFNPSDAFITWAPPSGVLAGNFRIDASVLCSVPSTTPSENIQFGVYVDSVTVTGTGTYNIGSANTPATYVMSGFATLNAGSTVQVWASNISLGGTPVVMSISANFLTLTQIF